MKIGIIGCDTSHCVAFARALQGPERDSSLPEARITTAFPGGSPDFEMSRSRVDGFTSKLRETYGVRMVDSPEEVAEECDGLLITSVDGRVHLDQFQRVAGFGKPVFIDKPFAVNSSDANSIVELARKKRIPLMSCSALRYAESLQAALGDESGGPILASDFYGTLSLEPTQPGLFWYGIHCVEMLNAAMGRGCTSVTAVRQESQEVFVAEWEDGRVGVIRGFYGRKGFGGMIHREEKSIPVDATAGRPYYIGMLEQVLQMFTTGRPPFEPDESLEIVRMIEAANRSRESGQPAAL